MNLLMLLKNSYSLCTIH